MSLKIKLSDELELSRIVHGHWRLSDWNFTNQELLRLTQKAIELGITTFDHADIYGDYSCEKLFGNALTLNKGIRKNIKIVTKCGIKLLSDKYPKRKIKHYDYRYDHIVSSVENSLKNFQTDYIDLLLLHRPAPFFNPEDVAKAFRILKHSGKVLHFGVSNFNIQQFELLNKYADEKLLTNQIEISPLCLEHFRNGNIEFLQKDKIKPMAWSPMAAGRILHPANEREQNTLKALKEVGEELSIMQIDKIVYTWLLKHPSEIIPVLGTRKIDRIKNAVDALQIEMSLEQWYKIYIASEGKELP
jgi:predicted oxidoreductase